MTNAVWAIYNARKDKKNFAFKISGALIYSVFFKHAVIWMILCCVEKSPELFR
jgi:hypothetical protein